MKGSRIHNFNYGYSGIALFLSVALFLSAVACRKDIAAGTGWPEETVTAVVRPPLGCTKSASPDEDGIWDMNFYVTDIYGSIIAHRFTAYSSGRTDDIPFEFKGLANVEYHIYVLANIGYDLGIHDESWIQGWKLYLRYPEGNIRGIAMSGHLTYVPGTGGHGSAPAIVQLTRMMAKVTLIFDGSRLSSGISMNPGDARICNCPRCAYAFRQSVIENEDDIFPVGYSSRWTKNKVDLYMLENTGWNAPDTERSSYIEASFDYESPAYISMGRGLLYRFYLHESADTGKAEDSTAAPSAYGVSRNGHYIITIQPEGTGLDGTDPFRTDISYLKKL